MCSVIFIWLSRRLTPVGQNVIWIIEIVSCRTGGLESLTCDQAGFFFFECEMWRKCWSQKAVLNQQVNCDQVNLSAITCSLSYTWFPRAPVKRVNSMKKWPNRIGSFWAVRSVGHSLVLHTRALLLYRLTQSWPRVYYCFFSLWSPNDKEKTKNKQASA